MKSTLIIIIAVLIGFFGTRIITKQRKTSEDFQKSLEIAKQNSSHKGNEHEKEIIKPVELNNVEKLKTAELSFIDFQYYGREGYKNYCAKYNINIDNFINKFNEINKKYDDSIKDRTTLGPTAKQTESVNKNIDYQVKASQNGKFNPEKFCRYLNDAANSDEITNFDFKHVSLEMAEILLK